MKRAIVLIAFFAMLIPAFSMAAPYLACDLPPTGTTITQTQVEITIGTGAPTVYAGTATIQGTNLILYDLGALGAAKYTFRARWAEASGLWSDWSDPLVSGKPAKPGSLRVVP